MKAALSSSHLQCDLSVLQRRELALCSLKLLEHRYEPTADIWNGDALCDGA